MPPRGHQWPITVNQRSNNNQERRTIARTSQMKTLSPSFLPIPKYYGLKEGKGLLESLIVVPSKYPSYCLDFKPIEKSDKD